jgi:hypothetical protein
MFVDCWFQIRAPQGIRALCGNGEKKGGLSARSVEKTGEGVCLFFYVPRRSFVRIPDFVQFIGNIQRREA